LLSDFFQSILHVCAPSNGKLTFHKNNYTSTWKNVKLTLHYICFIIRLLTGGKLYKTMIRQKNLEILISQGFQGNELIQTNKGDFLAIVFLDCACFYLNWNLRPLNLIICLVEHQPCFHNHRFSKHFLAHR
jgi:hypothetical protein